MPAPLTTALLAFGAILLPVSETAAAIISGFGVANQVTVNAIWAVNSGKEPTDGLG